MPSLVVIGQLITKYPSLNRVKSTIPFFSSKAECATVSLNNRYKLSKLLNKVALKLFHSSIHPLLTYDAEVWSPFDNSNYEQWDSSQTEIVHLFFCRYVLGVNRSATKNLVRVELGEYPIKTSVNVRTIMLLLYTD